MCIGDWCPPSFTNVGWLVPSYQQVLGAIIRSCTEFLELDGVIMIQFLEV